MKAVVYSNTTKIGSADLQLVDESMGVVAGQFFPNSNYQKIRKKVWLFHTADCFQPYEQWKQLLINVQLENGLFLVPIGGFLIHDIEGLSEEEITLEAAGNYRQVIEDNFLINSPQQCLFAPWEFITIEQKIAFEEELYKEIGKNSSNNKQGHPLRNYEFGAIATTWGREEVLFAVSKKGEEVPSYVVIHLTWIGKLEKQELFPRAEFFEDFDHFLYYKMYPDKRDWED